MQQVSSELVSVIIPCYNAAPFIIETIQSVFDQSYTNYEIIVINDGSTDNSGQKVQQLTANPKVFLVNKPNGGVSSARNQGLRLAKGKYIALLDADDIWLKDNLKEKVSILERNKELLFVYSDMFEFLENGSTKVVQGYSCPDIAGAYLEQQTLPVPGVCSNIVFRRSIINDKGLFFDENLTTAADQDFMIFLSMYGNGRHIPKPLWKYRVLISSMSRKVSSIEKDQLYSMNKYNRLKLYRNYSFKRLCFSRNYLILAGCFWNDAKNKYKGLQYLIKALLNDMSLIFKLIGKLKTKQ